MFDQKIGCQLCCFYESWAWALEQMGNFKKANMIYQEGLKRRAEPFDLLEKKYRWDKKFHLDIHMVFLCYMNILKNINRIYLQMT